MWQLRVFHTLSCTGSHSETQLLANKTRYLRSRPLAAWQFFILLFKHILCCVRAGTDVTHSKATFFPMALFTQERAPPGTLINIALLVTLSCGVSIGQNHSSVAVSEQVAGGKSLWSPVMDGDGAITNGISLRALWSIWTWERTHMPWLTDAARGLGGTMWLLDEGEGKRGGGMSGSRSKQTCWGKGSEIRGARLGFRYCLAVS